jgi:UDP-N-acetylglucosamine 3-dehydrogenase
MIHVGVIGTGFMAKTHLDAYQKMKDVRIMAVTAVNEEKGKALAQSYECEFISTAEEMMARKDVHMIDVCTPTFVHEKLVIMAAEAGKHVICEKPLALSVEEVDSMIAATKKAGVKFMAAQVLRFWPEYVEIKKLYDNGDLGATQIVYASRLTQFPTWSEWFKDVSKSGGGLYDLHLHDIDYLYHLFGPVDSVYATGKKNENGAWNHVVSQLTFKNGSKACVEASYQMPEGYPFTATLRIVGDEAAADYHFSAGYNLENLDESEGRLLLSKSRVGLTYPEVENSNPYYNELEYFVQCIVQNKEPDRVQPEDSKEVLKILIAIEASLENGEKQFL